MIELNTISGESFYLNSDLIFKVESLPDTLVILTDGNRLRVQEKPDEIIEKIVKYKRRIHSEIPEVCK